MNYYYITGTSSGIGKAIAELLLKNENNKVIGISRSQSIMHANYLHISIDLSKISLLKKFRFEKIEQADKVVLINNAGTLGDMKYMGDLNDSIAIHGWVLNMIAPGVLINQFMKTYRQLDSEKLIINISSGAANYPVDGWSIYCSSKASLDMITRTVELEQAKKNTGFKIYSVAPGIVDTQMQGKIRETNKEDFSRVGDFIKLKENNELIKPEVVADRLHELIKTPEKFKDALVRFEY